MLAAKPKDAQARFLKGLIFAEQGNAKDATDVFLQLTKDYPDLPEPYNNLAVIYASQGQYDKARGALEQSIRTHPSYATAYENLGDVYAKLASQAYDKALQIDSANAAREEQARAGARSGRRLRAGRDGGARQRRPPRRRRRPRRRAKEPAKSSRRSRRQARGAENPAEKPAEKPAAAEAGERRDPRHGERLGEGLVGEGRGRLPRLLRQGLQDARRRSARRLGEGAPPAHQRAQEHHASRSTRPR